jgi:hypothetical protein
MPGKSIVGSRATWPRFPLTDGTAAAAIGLVVSIATILGWLTSFTSGWLVWATLVVVAALVGIYWWSRKRENRTERVRMIAVAEAPGRRPALSQRCQQEIEVCGPNERAVTLPKTDLLGDVRRDIESMIRLAERVSLAAQIASRVHLIPIMPLHAAFLLGAHIDAAYADKIDVFTIRKDAGEYSSALATSLRSVDSFAAPLQRERSKEIHVGSPTNVALAIDNEGDGADFFNNVGVACQENGVHMLHKLRSVSPTPPENQQICTTIVSQVVRAWQEISKSAHVPPLRNAIFLNGSPAVAVALGAQLAAADRSHWTVFGFDRVAATFEQYPVMAHEDGQAGKSPS